MRTEAYLKGRGCGLGISPATIAAGPAPRFSGQNRPGATRPVTMMGGWSLVDLDVGSGHVGALALAGASDAVVDRDDPDEPGPDYMVQVHDFVIE